MNMKISLLTILVLIGLFLSGCDSWDLSKVSKEDVNKVIVCPDRYIRFGSSCCLDKNDNKICDMDEKEEEKPAEGCEDECSSDGCSDFDYVECLMQSDGCKDKVVNGKVIGKCGVECTSDNNCVSDEECKEYICVDKDADCDDECSSDSCDDFDFIDCEMKSDGCKDEKNMGKVVGKCDVECLTNSDCESYEECDNYECILKIGLNVLRVFESDTIYSRQKLSIEYIQEEGQSYSIIQDIPEGWDAESLSPDGKFREYINDGENFVLEVTAPEQGGVYKFGGQYFVYPDTDWSDFNEKSITVIEEIESPEPLSRTFSSLSVKKGGTISIAYEQESGSAYGVIEDVPSGWEPSRTLSPDGKLRLFADGEDITVEWEAPNAVGAYTFKGQYFVYPDTDWSDFDQIVVDVTS